MKMSSIPAIIIMASFTFTLPACQRIEEWRSGDQPSESLHAVSLHEEAEHSEGEHAEHKIVVTSPIAKDVVSTQRYVCQIHS